MRFLISMLVAVTVWCGTAMANPNDMTVEEVRAHPDFVADDYSLSAAMNSAEDDAAPVYEWIGYIPHGDTRVYYTSFGEPLTCVEWRATGEWVPLWVVDALDKLLQDGYIKI